MSGGDDSCAGLKNESCANTTCRVPAAGGCRLDLAGAQRVMSPVRSPHGLGSRGFGAYVRTGRRRGLAAGRSARAARIQAITCSASAGGAGRTRRRTDG